MNQRDLDKNAARRLAVIRHAREVTGNVGMTCRYYGISLAGSVWFPFAQATSTSEDEADFITRMK